MKNRPEDFNNLYADLNVTDLSNRAYGYVMSKKWSDLFKDEMMYQLILRYQYKIYEELSEAVYQHTDVTTDERYPSFDLLSLKDVLEEIGDALLYSYSFWEDVNARINVSLPDKDVMGDYINEPLAHPVVYMKHDYSADNIKEEITNDIFVRNYDSAPVYENLYTKKLFTMTEDEATMDERISGLLLLTAAVRDMVHDNYARLVARFPERKYHKQVKPRLDCPDDEKVTVYQDILTVIHDNTLLIVDLLAAYTAILDIDSNKIVSVIKDKATINVDGLNKKLKDEYNGAIKNMTETEKENEETDD